MLHCRNRWPVLLGGVFALLFAGCGDLTAGDYNGGGSGSRFNKHFYYYYSEVCRYDAIGPFDCGRLSSVSPAFKVSLRIDSDDFATLNLDGDYYYFPGYEYDQGHDAEFGAYYRFYEDEDQLDVYKDGYTLAFWGSDGYVTFYYYEMPY